ncbi:MAG TPA: NADH-quinone oxidoreductase subunit L [Ktedonobacteraceae bacterium]
MGVYQYSWLVLLAPLLSFVVIIFGTRMWDLASRPRATGASAASPTHDHADTHDHDAHGDEHDSHGDDDDPKVPALSLGARVSAYVGILIMLASCVFSWYLLLNSVLNPGVLQYGGSDLTLQWNWGSANFLAPYDIRFHVDHLALAMLVVVTTISLLVQIYSQGYMENSAGYARFFSYLSLFTFSMLVIVFAANFLVIFIGWELVGLSSYLLIGFWINKRAKPDEDRPAPATAAMQAFVVNRIGDVGFIIGIMILFWKTGTYSFAELMTGPHSVATAFANDKTLLTIAMVLVFCGAIGKSAQIPLQIWLPNAMEGPTPVSALIHAATMVAAGVYMVARTFPLFAAAGPQAFQVVAWIGGITALYAALTALTQTDFKRVLAYSTVSQLGYMFVGLGLSGLSEDPFKYGPGPGMFHLFTHAFFKGLLFLGAGSVINNLHHATHEEVQDMRKMGGLAAFMPITAFTFLIATLTISGFPLFSGFFSKDFIISLARENSLPLYIITLGTAGLTAFYMFRAYIVAFGGKGGSWGGLWGNKEIYRGVGTPREAPLTITIPLILLAIASVVAGYWTGMFSYLTPGATNLSILGTWSEWPTWAGELVPLIGFVWAWYLYSRFSLAQIHEYVEKRAVLRFLYRLTLRKFYLDDLYYWLTKYVFLGIAHIASAFDSSIVDGIVNGVASLVTNLGKGLRHTETGRVQSYMYGFFGGIAALAVVVFVLVAFAQGGVKLW